MGNAKAMEPDWHPDPHDKNMLRYHDGTGWTDLTFPAPRTFVRDFWRGLFRNRKKAPPSVKKVGRVRYQ